MARIRNNSINAVLTYIRVAHQLNHHGGRIVIANVQLDKQAEFDKLWRWAKKYMLYTSYFYFAQPCVFVKQLPGPILCASSHPEDPLSRSYRVSLPSSLTVNHSSALVYSTRLRVSVCGTGTTRIKFSGFSREYAYVHYWIVPKDAPYCQVRLFLRICLQESTSTPFNGLFRQSAALSLLRLHVTP